MRTGDIDKAWRESSGLLESLRLSLTAMVASVRAGNHKIVWVVGESLEDAYRYGSETTVEWPVAYTTIDIWDPRPEELLVLTPAAVAALSRSTDAGPHERAKALLEMTHLQRGTTMNTKATMESLRAALRRYESYDGNAAEAGRLLAEDVGRALSQHRPDTDEPQPRRFWGGVD